MKSTILIEYNEYHFGIAQTTSSATLLRMSRVADDVGRRRTMNSMNSLNNIIHCSMNVLTVRRLPQTRSSATLLRMSRVADDLHCSMNKGMYEVCQTQ